MSVQRRTTGRIVRNFVKQLWGSNLGKAGIILLLSITLFILVGPLFITYSPYVRAGLPNQPPSLSHIFGTDFQGKDLASQVIWGAYPTLYVASVAAFGATMLGFFAGLFSGYFAKAGSVISGITDAVMTLSPTPAILLIGTLFLATNEIIIVLLMVFFWVTVSRSVRAQVYATKKLKYIEAAKTSGLSDMKIILTVMLPEVGPIAIAYFIFNFTLCIAVSTTVEFLGLGNTTMISWGNILFWAQQYAFFDGDWWWYLIPGLFISFVTIGFALIGFSLEEIMHPRLRTK